MNTKFKTFIYSAALSTVILSFSSCEDLDVKDLNDPDTERVLASQDDVKSLLEGAYLSYWQGSRAANIHIASLAAADQLTCSWGNFYLRYISAEPRTPWDNTVSAPNDQISENFWSNSYAAISQANDGLKMLDRTKAENQGLLAYGKFLQGLAYGYLGLSFDKAYVVTEYTDLQSVEFLPYQAVVDSAVKFLTEAISIAKTCDPFELSSTVINGVTVNNELIEKLSSSYIARFLAMTPRTQAQTDAVDWSKVLTAADAGIAADFDFGPQGTGSPYANAIWWDENYIYLAQEGWCRIDNRIINLLDNQYPKKYWSDGVAQVVHSGKSAGEAVSSDKRLESDFEYLASVDFRPDRGYYHFSNYRYKRFDETMYKGLGTLYEFRGYDNQLLKAEALARLDRTSEAITILNNATLSRKSRGGLADISSTATKSEVLAAIFYERDIELISQGFMLGFYDMRRRDMLQKGTMLHWPVPGKELETIGADSYTYGGASNADGINTSNGGWFK